MPSVESSAKSPTSPVGFRKQSQPIKFITTTTTHADSLKQARIQCSDLYDDFADILSLNRRMKQTLINARINSPLKTRAHFTRPSMT